MPSNQDRVLIGITPSYDGGLNRGKIKMSGEYLGAVWAAGGIPVFLQWADPETESGMKKICEYAEVFDGFIFGGGVDVDPKYYGEAVANEKVEICEERDRFEFGLFNKVYADTKKPILGICRGSQLINTALGGSLIQHIDGHLQTEPSYQRNQDATLNKSSELYRIFAEADASTANDGRVKINSFHHQAVKEVSPKLIAAAVADDGIIEAVEAKDMSRFIIAVQWHPELFYEYDARSLALFKRFIKEASK